MEARGSSNWVMVEEGDGGDGDRRRGKSKCTPARKEQELSGELQKLSIPEVDKFCTPNIKFDRLQKNDQNGIQTETVEFRKFVAREAQLDEEYWTAAWLRAESHWEDKENDRYADNHKRKFAEQEFNAMKRRYNAQLGDKCKCIVMVTREDENVKRTVLKSVVGTLDLSIRYLSHGETFPGELVKAPLFCLVDKKSSSRYGYISNVCVAKSARRQGIATNLLQYAIMSAKPQGVEHVFVHVDRNNKAAQALYQKMGFEVVDAASSQLLADRTYLLRLQASNYIEHSFC
ncbi:hypothetical protein BUALT_Bualt16G0042800 [Buddleja alternifolia]|uniref:N-acetyltransferase domain-containing protein n=1 Tax=Buddleja alternifolia TaxID=168488 RepID=A0AAV6W6M6_9LAMI|nr:hypothetical protein BUALT_Bualt16G0042800 [Buddleja alternifolia]